ncbi:uncharacterized protein IWZ02DRAFT_438685 [Phyllosticta citriasiana]|uniref:Uncharacterized protein n=1 Tax=Phyllosticta citriasiana TaxID=595635 RepID=A0ABR1KKN1_9PEZI
MAILQIVGCRRGRPTERLLAAVFSLIDGRQWTDGAPHRPLVCSPVRTDAWWLPTSQVDSPEDNSPPRDSRAKLCGRTRRMPEPKVRGRPIKKHSKIYFLLPRCLRSPNLPCGFAVVCLRCLRAYGEPSDIKQRQSLVKANDPPFCKSGT